MLKTEFQSSKAVSEAFKRFLIEATRSNLLLATLGQICIELAEIMSVTEIKQGPHATKCDPPSLACFSATDLYRKN